MNDDEALSPQPRERLIRTLVTWLVLPLTAATLLILSGMHLGAHNPQAWYTRLVRWLAAPAAPAAPAPPAPPQGRASPGADTVPLGRDTLQ